MSTISKEPEHLFYSGVTFAVEWYRDAAGRMLARDYYESLPAEDQKRLNDLVAYLADCPIGTRMPKTLYNEEDAVHKIYAFKPRDHRFFNFMTANRKIIILNAYRKHSQRLTRKDLRDLEAAVQARSDYLVRVKEGTYYERLA